MLIPILSLKGGKISPLGWNMIKLKETINLLWQVPALSQLQSMKSTTTSDRVSRYISSSCLPWWGQNKVSDQLGRYIVYIFCLGRYTPYLQASRKVESWRSVRKILLVWCHLPDTFFPEPHPRHLNLTEALTKWAKIIRYETRWAVST